MILQQVNRKKAMEAMMLLTEKKDKTVKAKWFIMGNHHVNG